MERQAAHFYRITVTESDLKSGLIITCKSTGKDKFKLVFFDQEVSCKCFFEQKIDWNCSYSQGHVTMVQESQQNKRCSAADLYVVPYGRYNLMESMPLSMMKHLEDDVPPVFMILDTFDKDIKVNIIEVQSSLNFLLSFYFISFLYFMLRCMIMFLIFVSF